MIIEFKVKNYLSIKDEQVLSFEATSLKDLKEYHFVKVNDKLDILKIGAIYGANASGKTNILNAISFVSDLVNYSLNKQINDTTGFIPFKFDKEKYLEPGIFEIKFLNNNKINIYGFELNGRYIIKEYLYKYDSNRKRLIFERKLIDNEKFKYSYKWGTVLKGEIKKISSIVKNNTLFLSESSKYKNDILNEIFGWFHKVKLPTIIPKKISSDEVFKYTVRRCLQDNKLKKKLIKILQYSDFSIKDIIISEKTISQSEYLQYKIAGFDDSKFLSKNSNMYKSDVSFIHTIQKNGKEVSLSLDIAEESMGTRRFFELLGPLIQSQNQSSVLIIDELETSLHPMLVKHFLKLFLEESKNSQLVFTTHNIETMDLDILRRDEIWFTEMNKDKGTELYCLSEFSTRNNQNIDKFYLNGHYGAIPNI